MKPLFFLILSATFLAAQECPKAQVYIDAAKVALTNAELSYQDAKAWDLRNRLVDWKVNCLLEADNAQVQTTTAGLEEVIARLNTYVACRRTRHWWQVWKRRCRMED